MGPQPTPQSGYNQEEEVRRFQEQRRREEQERIRREQEFIRRRMAPRPEDPQINARGQPYWPYNRPMVGGRVTKEVVDVMNNVPGVNRLTDPALVAAQAFAGKLPVAPSDPILPDRPGGPKGKSRTRPRAYQSPAIQYGNWQPRRFTQPLPPNPAESDIVAARKRYGHAIEDAKRNATQASQRTQLARDVGDEQGAQKAFEVKKFYENEIGRLERERQSLPYQKPRNLAPKDPTNAASPSTERVRRHRLAMDYEAAEKRYRTLKFTYMGHEKLRERLLQFKNMKRGDPETERVASSLAQEGFNPNQIDREIYRIEFEMNRVGPDMQKSLERYNDLHKRYVDDQRARR
jgi:hypothetical protein